ncbi:MAG: MraY family glycosyltransferase, partial [Bacteroidota bacterium]
CLVCLSLAGALLAFLRFNFHQAKIFMGDTGSMLIGLMCGIFSLLLLRLDLPQSAHTSLLPVAYAIIAVPVVDLLRVFVCRMLQGHSPFKADRIHIHHLLGNIGFHSVKICLLLLAFQFCLFLVALQLLPLLSWFAALSVLFICTLAFLLGVQWLHHLKEKKSAPLTYKQSIK